jgi:transcriptional regulator with XRE-family HTH domain
MRMTPVFTFDMNRLATAMWAKRDRRGLRAIAEEIEERTGRRVSVSTLSRIENEKGIDIGTYCIVCAYLGAKPGDFFVSGA